jgi:hypothetical protein
MDLHGGRSYTFQWLDSILDRAAQINQCLNDIENMKSWDGGGLGGIVTKHTVSVFGGPAQKLYHVSAGKAGSKGKKCTLFFTPYASQAYIVAAGEHASSSKYSKTWTRQGSDFPSTLDLEAKPIHITIAG